MKAIVAVDVNWGIGKNNDLLFNIPEDMKFFREKTKGVTVCMGYNTLLSFPQSKPLKNRVNVVLAPSDVERDDCVVVHTLKELAVELKKYDTDKTFVIGGAMFYKTMLPYCDEVFVTKVQADGGATVFYPNLDKADGFKCVYVSDEIESNGLKLNFTTYKNEKPLKFEG